MATISNNEIKIKYSLDTTDLANATALFDRLSAEDRQLLNDLKRLQAQLNATGQAGQTAGTNISRGNQAAAGSLNDLRNRVADLTNRLNNLNPSASNYETILKRLQRAQANLNIATAQMNDKLGKSQQQFSQLNNTLGGLGKTLLAVFSTQQLLSFGKSVLDTAIKMEGLKKAIEFTAGSAIAGASDFRFLQDIAEKLGLPLEAAAEGFKTFSAAASRVNITTQEQRQMFTDLSGAMAALQLDAQSAGLVFFGFGQLISKAKVSSQELFHQIGERLPIAVEAAQIALGRMNGTAKVTTSELLKMVEAGIDAARFAPEFTKALGELSKGAQYVETLGKEVNRLDNEWTEFKNTLADDKNLSKAIGLLRDFVSWMNRKSEAINYYQKEGLFPDVSFRQFKKFEKESKDMYDKMILTADDRFKTLNQLNKNYQTLLTEDTKEGEAVRAQIRAAFNAERERVVISLKEQIVREEDLIQSLQKKIETTTYKKKVIQFKQEIAIAEAAKQAFLKLYSDIPEIATFLPDPEKAEKERKKREKALEDAYRKELARIEAFQKAKEDLIKADMPDGRNRDIEIAKNNENFNKQLYTVDLKYAKLGLELAKNNGVERNAEIKLNRAQQNQIVEEANEEALKAEKDYLEKAMEVLQDQQRKRREAIQTDEDNEIQTSIDFFEDKIKTLEKKYTEESSKEAIELEIRKKLHDNYYAARKKLAEEGEQAIADIVAKYRQKEKEDTILSNAEVTKVLIQASVIRASVKTRNEVELLKIAEEGALSEIKVERDLIKEQIKLNKENTTLSIQDRKNRNAELEAQDILLQAKELQIADQTQLEIEKIRISRLQDTISKVSDLMGQFVTLYENNLNREKEALNIRYNEEVRLADGNKQKLAQLAQDKAKAEYEIELKQFKMRRDLAIADIVMKTAPIIAQQLAGIITAPLALISYAAQAAQIGIVLSQQPPVPPYKEGTKGRPHPGGPALVGEAGMEKVITTDGQVYYTPPMATLIDLPKGAQVIPNHKLSGKELFWANALNDGKPISQSGGIEKRLDMIGGILQTLPVHQINMNEKGFEKFVRTPRRTTRILNNQFPVKH